MTSTAVVPFYRVTRGMLGIGSGIPFDVYRCRSCAFEHAFTREFGRDVRMPLLARHLADAHRTGPLA